IPHHTVTFTSDKTTVPLDYMIDDKIENYEALAAHGVHVVLLDRPWNPDPGFAYARRAFSLAAFVDMVIDQEQEREELARAINAREINAILEVRSVSSTGGEKGVKAARHSLIPPYPLALLAEHFAK